MLNFAIFSQNFIASKTLTKVLHKKYPFIYTYPTKVLPFLKAQIKSQFLADAFPNSFTKMSSI